MYLNTAQFETHRPKVYTETFEGAALDSMMTAQSSHVGEYSKKEDILQHEVSGSANMCI